METVNATQCRRDLISILERVVADNDMCVVTTGDGNAVIVSEDAWNGLVETLHIMSDPDMLPSIEDAEREYPEGAVEWREWLRTSAGMHDDASPRP